jgi:hypothetical protein
MVKQAQQATTMQQGELQLALARAEGEAGALRGRISHLESELNSYPYKIFFLHSSFLSHLYLAYL